MSRVGRLRDSSTGWRQVFARQLGPTARASSQRRLRRRDRHACLRALARARIRLPAGTPTVSRPGAVHQTVGWNVVEGPVSIYAAIIAGSIARLGFGVGSFVGTTAGAILIWRLRAERRARDREKIERLDHRARRLVGISLFLLAAYIVFDAVKSPSHR